MQMFIEAVLSLSTPLPKRVTYGFWLFKLNFKAFRKLYMHPIITMQMSLNVLHKVDNFKTHLFM